MLPGPVCFNIRHYLVRNKVGSLDGLRGIVEEAIEEIMEQLKDNEDFDGRWCCS